jgi:hypothetical protein
VRVCFLLDENLSPRLKPAVQRYDVAIRVLRIGDEGAPPLGTSDPEILSYAEQTQLALVTDNRSSMPVHVANHFAAGGHHWGIFNVRPDTPIGDLVEAMILIWGASEAQEWVDRLEWIP